jgi:hypothetical protein
VQEGDEKKEDTDVSAWEGPSYKLNGTKRGSRLQDHAPESKTVSTYGKYGDPIMSDGFRCPECFPEGSAKAGATGKSGDPDQYTGTWGAGL